MKGALWEEDTSINGAHFSITGALWEEKQGGPISINGSCSSMACAYGREGHTSIIRDHSSMAGPLLEDTQH